MIMNSTPADVWNRYTSCFSFRLETRWKQYCACTQFQKLPVRPSDVATSKTVPSAPFFPCQWFAAAFFSLVSPRPPFFSYITELRHRDTPLLKRLCIRIDKSTTPTSFFFLFVVTLFAIWESCVRFGARVLYCDAASALLLVLGWGTFF